MKNGASYAKWIQNEPMVGVHPQVCHGLDKDVTIRDGNKFTAGQVIDIDLYGTAVHNGGHCSFWYSTDDETFTKLIDVKDCTLDGAKVQLPKEMPIECNERCTFAWSWTPRVSGLCEIYMNCADIQVTGATGIDSVRHPVSINFQTKFIDVGKDAGYGCKRVDDVSHWTTIFGQIDTNYDFSDNEHTFPDSVDVVDPVDPIDHTVCYIDTAMAINLENDIATNGRCGSGAGDYRCDDGSCCSQDGYCGTEPQYCTNAIGDWRVTACDDSSSSTAAPDTTSSAPEPSTTAPVTTAPATTTPLNQENIQIVNYHGSSEWYFAATLNGVSHGFAVNKFEILKADNQWFECGQCSDSASLYTCSVDSVIALPLSVRLTASGTNGAVSIITSNDVVSAFTYGITHDFGSNFASTSPVTPTVPASTAASGTAASTLPNGDGQSITLTNRQSSTAWYYSVSVSAEVASVEMKGSTQSTWQSGEFVSEFAGDYYRFQDGEYVLPLSFRVTTSDGAVGTADDLINSFVAGVSGTIMLTSPKPFNGGFTNNKEDGSVFGMYGLIAILAVIIIVLIVAVIVWKRKQSKATISMDKEVTIENSADVDPEIQLEEVDGGKVTQIDIETR